MRSVIQNFPPNFNFIYTNDTISQIDLIATTEVAAFHDANSNAVNLTVGASSNVNVEAFHGVNVTFSSNSSLKMYNYEFDDQNNRTDVEILKIQKLIDQTVISSKDLQLSLAGGDAYSTTSVSRTIFEGSNNAQVLSTTEDSFQLHNPVYISSNLVVENSIVGYNNLAISGNIFTSTLNMYKNKTATINNEYQSQVAYAFYINSYDQLELIKFDKYGTSNVNTKIRQVGVFGPKVAPYYADAASNYQVLEQFNGLVNSPSGQTAGSSTILWFASANSNDIYYNIGNVGIGTIAPQTPLHVSGTTTFDGNVVPKTTSVNNIGSSLKRFLNLYCNGVDIDGNLLISGNINISGDILPSTDKLYNIGSSNKWFKDAWIESIHIGENTLYIGDKPFLATIDGNLNFSADSNQALSMSTTGTGSTQVLSESNIQISASGSNSHISINSSGTISVSASNTVSFAGNTSFSNITAASFSNLVNNAASTSTALPPTANALRVVNDTAAFGSNLYPTVSWSSNNTATTYSMAIATSNAVFTGGGGGGLQPLNNLSDLTNVAVARNNLGLGTSCNVQFSNLTLSGDIVATSTLSQNIGSSNNRFSKAWIETLYLGSNTLYLGDTPVLGTTADTINIRADPGQSINIKTTGTGSTLLSSDKDVFISSSNTNANVTIQSSGPGSRIAFGAQTEIDFTAPNSVFTGNATVTGSITSAGLTVNGDMVVTGSNFVANVTTVTVKDNLMVLNSGQVGSGVSGSGISGIEIDRGDLPDYRMIFDETDDMFKVGQIGSEEIIASRPWVGTYSAMKSSNLSDLQNVLVARNNLGLGVSCNVAFNNLSLNNLTATSYSNLVDNAISTSTILPPTANALKIVNDSVAWSSNTAYASSNMASYSSNQNASFAQTSISTAGGSNIVARVTSFTSNVSVLGSLGMGTSSPQYPVDVRTTTAHIPMHLVGSNNTAIMIGTAASSNYGNGLVRAGDVFMIGYSNDVSGTDNAGLVVGPRSTAAKGIRIDSSGNVGVGTSNPSQRLHVLSTTNGDGIAVDNTLWGATVSIKANSTNGVGVAGVGREGKVAFYDHSNLTGSISCDNTQGLNNTSNLFDIRISPNRNLLVPNGNVGIGTSSPVQRLHLHGTDQLYMNFTNNTTGQTLWSDGFRIGLNATNDASIFNAENTHMYFGTNATTRMTLTSNGNLGIGGVTTPLYPLHTGGDIVMQGGNFGYQYMVMTGASYKDHVWGWSGRISSLVDQDNNLATTNDSNFPFHARTPLMLDAASVGFLRPDNNANNVIFYTRKGDNTGSNYFSAGGIEGGWDTGSTEGSNSYIAIQTKASDSTWNTNTLVAKWNRIGLGTNNPVSTLHVVGDTTLQGTTTLSNSVSSVALLPLSGNSLRVSGKITLGSDGSIEGSNVWLGTFGSNLNFKHTAVAFASSALIQDAAGKTTLGAGTVTVAGGNVGIGTTSPSTPLHVKATVATTGILQENCSAGDANSKTVLGTKIYSTIMPVMSGTSAYTYMTSGTASTYYRLLQTATTYFTGQHAGVPDTPDIKANILDYVGLIVSSAGTGYVSYNPVTGDKQEGKDAIKINEALPNIKLACTDNDPAVFGVLSDKKDNASHNPDGTEESDSDPQFANDLYDRVRVNSIGEGGIWVCNINGNISNGDYITTCAIPGIGKKQNDDILHNYTVAKATIACDFDLSSTAYQCVEFVHEDTTYKKAFIGCTYHCG